MLVCRTAHGQCMGGGSRRSIWLGWYVLVVVLPGRKVLSSGVGASQVQLNKVDELTMIKHHPGRAVTEESLSSGGPLSCD